MGRKKYSKELKAQIALDAIKGQQPLPVEKTKTLRRKR